MIAYRPIPPLTLGKSTGWRSVLASVVVAGLLGTAAFGAAAEAAPATGLQLSSAGGTADAGPAGEGAGGARSVATS
jgi:hypothetical protein